MAGAAAKSTARQTEASQLGDGQAAVQAALEETMREMSTESEKTPTVHVHQVAL